MNSKKLSTSVGIAVITLTLAFQNLDVRAADKAQLDLADVAVIDHHSNQIYVPSSEPSKLKAQPHTQARRPAGSQTVKVSGRNLASTSNRKVKRSLAALPVEEKTNTSVRDIHTEEASGTGLLVFLGVGGGYFSVKPKGAADLETAGPGLLAKGELTLYNPSLAVELGFSWIQSTVKGSSQTTNSNSSTVKEAETSTRAVLIELSPRYRFTPSLELGPTVGVLTGSNAGFGGPNDSFNTPIFVGAKAAYLFDGNDTAIRIFAQGATSMTIPDRNVMMVTAGIEIGLPIISGKTVVRERETRTVRKEPHREIIETETTVVQPVEVVKEVTLFSFDDQIVHFEFDQAKLASESEAFLAGLGKFLAENPSFWGGLRIEGHTDSRGSDDYNDRLSQERTETVKRALVQAGVPSEKLETRGYGKNRRIASGESEISLARNRRVEMSFSEVTDARVLREEINRLRFATIHPSTCQGDHCK